MTDYVVHILQFPKISQLMVVINEKPHKNLLNTQNTEIIRPHCPNYIHRCGLLLRTEYHSLSICLLVSLDTLVSPAKMAEAIEMQFGLWTRVGPRMHVLDGAQIPHAKGQLLEERTCPMTLCHELCKNG